MAGKSRKWKDTGSPIKSGMTARGKQFLGYAQGRQRRGMKSESNERRKGPGWIYPKLTC